MELEWPWQRRDVLDGLDVLAAPPKKGWGWEGSWLESAVHTVVDDTGWDYDRWGKAAGFIGKSLRNEEEAEACQLVVDAICRVSERQGSLASDEKWWADREWPLVRELARNAAGLMRANDEAAPPELKQFSDLTAEDFQRYPVWVGVHGLDDEEPWYEDTDEETFRAYLGRLPVDPKDATYLVSATATLADGSQVPGFYFLTPADERMQNLDQPQLFAGGKSWGFFSGMWGFRESYADEVYEALGRGEDQVFPITFTPVPGVSEAATPRTVRGSTGGMPMPRPKKSWRRRLFGS